MPEDRKLFVGDWVSFDKGQRVGEVTELFQEQIAYVKIKGSGFGVVERQVSEVQKLFPDVGDTVSFEGVEGKVTGRAETLPEAGSFATKVVLTIQSGQALTTKLITAVRMVRPAKALQG